jgi:hypothetical protein
MVCVACLLAPMFAAVSSSQQPFVSCTNIWAAYCVNHRKITTVHLMSTVRIARYLTLLLCWPVVLQEIWWDGLAACTGTTTHRGAADGSAMSQHPCALRLAANSCLANACVHLMSQPLRALEEASARAVHVLLLAEVWDLLPWQLQQLEAACAGDGSEDVGASRSRSSSSSEVGLGRDKHDSSSSGGGGAASICLTSSSSSSSSQSGVWWSEQVYLDMPLLPPSHIGAAGEGEAGSSSSSRSSSSTLPAVTLERLQLVTCAMGQAQPDRMSSAALLLTLLLQRADPGLRSQYLGGPWGSLMLHTLAEAPERERSHQAACGWVQPQFVCDAELALEVVKVVAQGVGSGEMVFAVHRAATSSLLALAWAHLEVVQQQEGATSHSMPQDDAWSLVATVGAYHAHTYPLGERGIAWVRADLCRVFAATKVH